MTEVIRIRQTNFDFNNNTEFAQAIFGINNGGDWVIGIEQDGEDNIWNLIIERGTSDIVIDKLTSQLVNLLVVLDG